MAGIMHEEDLLGNEDRMHRSRINAVHRPPSFSNFEGGILHADWFLKDNNLVTIVLALMTTPEQEKERVRRT